MFMGSQQITGTKEMEAFCQQQAIVASAATVSGDAVTGDTVVSGGAVASGASVVTQGAFVADGISYKITGADTVTVNGLESNFEKTVLQIPEQVAYQQQTFTVTSVEMNQLQQCYENVKKIVIPKTVTENVVIKRRYLSEFVKIYNAGVIEEAYDGVTDKDDIKEYGLNGAFKAAYSEELLGSYSTKKYKKSNDLVLALQAFPYLQKMKFLGENAPKKIQVEQYVFDDSAYYQVPAGQKNAYQAVTKKITLHQWKGWSGVVAILFP